MMGSSGGGLLLEPLPAAGGEEASRHAVTDEH